MDAQGTVHKYGDNVDTDVIIPARYLNTSPHWEPTQHCMVDIGADFVDRVKPGDIIVANKNFGCDSFREHAPITIKASGIPHVIVSAFVRIFCRDSINIDLLILGREEAARKIQTGNEISVDFDTGMIRDLTTGKTYRVQPFPPFIQNIISKGGLLNSIASP